MDLSDPRFLSVMHHIHAVFAALNQGEEQPPLPEHLRDLSGIDLSDANNAVLSLRGVNFSDVDFTGANLARADFRTAYLERANFTNANLAGANLSAAILVGSNFTGATLNGADLSDAVLANSNITVTQRQSAKKAESAYPEEDVSKVLFLHRREPEKYDQEGLVVELHTDGRLRVKTSPFAFWGSE